MTVDNFRLIEKLLPEKATDLNLFFYLQIIKRRKENPNDIASNSVKINKYYIRSKEHLIKKEEEIKQLCKLNNARAYINLVQRDKKKMPMLMIKKIITLIENGNLEKLNEVFDSVSQTYKLPRDEKKWIIDIDSKDIDLINEVKNFLYEIRPTGDKIIVELPTINGFHLVTNVFDTLKFKNKYPDIDIVKDASVFLFYSSDV